MSKVEQHYSSLYRFITNAIQKMKTIVKLKEEMLQSFWDSHTNQSTRLKEF